MSDVEEKKLTAAMFEFKAAYDEAEKAAKEQVGAFSDLVAEIQTDTRNAFYEKALLEALSVVVEKAGPTDLLAFNEAAILAIAQRLGRFAHLIAFAAVTERERYLRSAEQKETGPIDNPKNV